MQNMLNMLTSSPLGQVGPTMCTSRLLRNVSLLLCRDEETIRQDTLACHVAGHSHSRAQFASRSISLTGRSEHRCFAGSMMPDRTSQPNHDREGKAQTALNSTAPPPGQEGRAWGSATAPNSSVHGAPMGARGARPRCMMIRDSPLFSSVAGWCPRGLPPKNNVRPCVPHLTGTSTWRRIPVVPRYTWSCGRQDASKFLSCW